MEQSWYSFQVSSGGVALMLLLALGLSVLLYTKKRVPWGRGMNVLLGFLRFAALFLLLFLLLNPLLRRNINETEPATFVLAIDDSQSVAMRAAPGQQDALRSWIPTFQDRLADKYQIAPYLLSGNAFVDSLSFDHPQTDLAQLLRHLQSVYRGSHLGGVVLLTDGIVSGGQNPAYQSYPFPVYTIGLGDTIAPRDVTIQHVRHNQVAYQGNRFPVSVTVSQKGFEGETTTITLSAGEAELAREVVNFSQNQWQKDFLVEAKEAGMRRYTVTIAPLEGESSESNNRQDFYVDIVEGRQRILLVAPAPHPDLAAIRAALDESANFETVWYIPGVSPLPARKDFDVIVNHQAFGHRLTEGFTANGIWHILGTRTALRQLPQYVSYFNISQKGNQTDMVRPALNPAFSKFKLTATVTPRMSVYTPVSVPFGEYQLSGPTEVLLYQHVGSIVTDRPLLTFFDDGSTKSALLAASGIWQWKLQEYGAEEDASLFNEMVLKTIQYLSTTERKKRFVVTPRRVNYTEGDRVFLDTEVYDQIYERSYGHSISLTITDEAGASTALQLTNNPSNSAFDLGMPVAGVYQYRAQVQVGAEKFTETGSFAVRNLNREGVNLTADHAMLRQLSEQSGGSFYSFQDRDALVNALETLHIPAVIHTTTEKFPLMRSIWLILLIVALLSAEWVLRKYLGAY